MVEGTQLLYLFTRHRFVSGTVMMLVSSFVYLRLRLWPIAIAMGYVETSFCFSFCKWGYLELAQPSCYATVVSVPQDGDYLAFFRCFCRISYNSVMTLFSFLVCRTGICCRRDFGFTDEAYFLQIYGQSSGYQSLLAIRIDVG